jgi:hypothetical protein
MYKKYKIINKKKYKIINLFNHLGGKMPDKYNEIVKQLTADIIDILLKLFKNDKLFNFIKQNLLIYMPDYNKNVFTEYLEKKLKFEKIKEQVEKKKDSIKSDSIKSDSKKSDTSIQNKDKSKTQIKKEEKIKNKEEWKDLDKQLKKQKKKDKKKASKTTQQTEPPSSEPTTETPSAEQQETPSSEQQETPSSEQQESTSAEPTTETPITEPTTETPITEPTIEPPSHVQTETPSPVQTETPSLVQLDSQSTEQQLDTEPTNAIDKTTETTSPKQQPDSENSDTSKQKIEKSQKQIKKEEKTKKMNEARQANIKKKEEWNSLSKEKKKEVKDKKKVSKIKQQTETSSTEQTTAIQSPVQQTDIPSPEPETKDTDEIMDAEFLDTKREKFKLEDKISKFLTILINIYYVYTIKTKIYFKSVENCLKALASLIIYFFNLGLLFKTGKSLAGFASFFVSSNLKQTEIDKIVDYNKHYLDSFDLINTFENIYKGSLRGILFDFFNLIINDPKFISLYKESDGDDSYVQKFFLLLYRDAKSKNIPFVDEIYLLLPSYWIPLNANIIFPEFKEEIKELLRKKLLALLHRDSMLHGFQGTMIIKINKIKEIKDKKIEEEKKIGKKRKMTKEYNLCIKGKYVYEKKDTRGNLIQIKYDEKNHNYHYGADFSINQCQNLLDKIRQENADKKLKQKSEEESNLGTKSKLVTNFKMGKKERKEKEKVSGNEEFIEYIWYKSIVDEFDKTAKVPHFL